MIPRPIDPTAGLLIVLGVLSFVLLLVYAYTRPDKDKDEENEY